jgi:hypothetical protein
MKTLEMTNRKQKVLERVMEYGLRLWEIDQANSSGNALGQKKERGGK